MLTTENSGVLLGIASHDPSKVWVTFIKTTFAKSLGRNGKSGETVEISKDDARVLFPMGKARKATEEEVAKVSEVVEVAEVDETDAAAVTEEVSEETTEAEEVKPKGKKRR